MSIVEKALERLAKGHVHTDPDTAVEQAFYAHRRRDSMRPIRKSGQTVTAKSAAQRRVDVDSVREECLLRLNLQRLIAEGILAPEELALRIADQYRRIKRPLLDTAFDEDRLAFECSNLLMISSAMSGDGKTFTAMNIAFSMARELDKTVLLVDADVAKPHISQLLGVSDRPGLIDVLLDESLDISDVLLRTDFPGHLSVLPAGQRHNHSTELLASRRMATLADELSRRYSDRMIVIDSPPLLATSEAPVLAELAGQVVLVIQSGVTPQHVVKESIERLNPEKPISLILNKNQFSLGNRQYGYYGQL